MMLDQPALAAMLLFQQEDIFNATFFRHVLASIVFAFFGIVFFAIVFFLMVKLTPFSIRKEIEDDHNTALAIVMASVILGIAIIVGMAVQG